LTRPLLLPILLLALAAAAPGADAQSSDPRGPAEIRDEHVFAQARLTLAAVSTATTPAGRWALAVSTLWSSSFSWDQDVPGEDPFLRRYLVDAETLTLDATLRRGLRPDLDVALRLPVRWRGGGAMDPLIDWWHRVGGFPDGNRPDFVRNAFRVEGLTTEHQPFSWTEDAGGGLGDAEIEARWRAVDRGKDAPSVALVARASLPTGTAPFDGKGLGGGLQLVGTSPLGRRFAVHAGVGGTAQDSGPVRGVRYEPVRAHGFFALEWIASRRLSLVAETDAATRLVRNVEHYPGTHWMLNVSGRIDLGARTRLDLGFTENLADQRSTTDFGLYAAVSLRR
jgi:hypothetical protein